MQCKDRVYAINQVYFVLENNLNWFCFHWAKELFSILCPPFSVNNECKTIEMEHKITTALHTAIVEEKKQTYRDSEKEIRLLKFQ